MKLLILANTEKARQKYITTKCWSEIVSKLCTRNYQDDTLLSRKVVNGVEVCPNCEKPTACHGKTVEERALFWSLTNDTGISSKTIVAHMLGTPKTDVFGMMPPSDASDRGRCIRLLELIPEWIPRLQELAQNEKPRDGVVISSSGISAETNSWAKQIPLIIKEGKL